MNINSCPFCGQQHTLEIIRGSELMDEDQEYWMHSESFAVICSAAKPNGKGGCGATGGFMQTEVEAVNVWNRRAAAPQAKPLITREQHFALREAFAIGAADSYFEAYPTHDNSVGRMIFERGFVRGFDSHERAIEAAHGIKE